MGNWAKENPGGKAGLHGAFMWSQKEPKMLRRDSRGEVEGHRILLRQINFYGMCVLMG